MDPRPVTRRQFLRSAAVLAAAPLAATDPPSADVSPDAAPPHFPAALAPEPPLPPGVCRQFGSARFRDLQTVRGRFSADSRWLIDYAKGGATKGMCTGYEIATGRRVRFVVPRDVGWNTDHWLVTTDHRLTVVEKGDDGYRVRRFDLPAGTPLPPTPVHGGQVPVVSADGRTAVVEGEDAKGTVCRGIDLATGRTLWENRDERFAHPLDPTGRVAGIGVYVGEREPQYALKLLDLATGRAVPLAPPDEGRYDLPQAWCSADSRRLVGRASAVQGKGQHVCAWDAATGRLLGAFVLNDQERVIGPTADGRGVFMTDGDEMQLIVRGVKDGKVTRRYPVVEVNAGGSAVTPDGKTLLLARLPRPGGADNLLIRLIDADTGLPLPQSPDPPGPLTRVWFPTATTVGAAFRTTNKHLDYMFWDMPSGRGRRVIDPRVSNEYGHRLLSDDQTEALSPDGRLLLRYEDGKACLFDTDTRTTAATCDTFPIGLFRFWLDSRTVVAGLPTALHLWEPAAGKTRTVPIQLPRFDRQSFGCHPSPDGRVLVYRGHLAKAKVSSIGWLDVGSGEVVVVDESVNSWLGGFAMSADGRRVTVRLSGKEELRALGFEERLPPDGFAIHDRDGRRWSVTTPCVHRYFDLTGCGRVLVTQCVAKPDPGGSVSQYTLEFWEVATGKLRRRYPLDRHLDDLCGSPCGRYVATVQADAPLYLWDVFGEVSDPRPEPKAADLPRLWYDLGWPEAERAFAAVRTLVQHPAAAVELLGAKLTPAEVPTPRWVAEQVGKLSDRDFRTRQAAENELAAVADRIGDQMRKALAAAETEEAADRLERVLAKGDRPADWLRTVRAVEVLEYAAGKPAEALLQRMAGGAEAALLTREAAAAVRRRFR